MKTPTKLINKIKDELVEDLSRYDDDYESWVEVVFDCPSNTLEKLLDQIPEEDSERVYEKILYPFVETLAP